MSDASCDVVHVVNQMRPGGIETIVVDLARHSRHGVRIFSLDGTTQSLVEGWPGLAPLAERLDGFNRAPRFEPALVVRLARRLRKLRPRAVFLHRLNPLFYGGLAARLARVPTIVHVEHDVWQYDDAKRLMLLKRAARVVRPVHFAVSEAIAMRLRSYLPRSDIRVVPAGVDLQRFRPRSRDEARDRLDLPRHARIIGTAGRLEVVKGHRVLVEAMATLPADTHLVIVGAGSERARLTAQVEALGLGPRVRMLGHREDLELILPALDVFCLPSFDEGLPRVLMEAQGAGIAIVASDVGSVRQVVDPATSRLVEANRPVELATAIEAQLRAPPSHQAPSHQAPSHQDCRAFVMKRFSFEQMLTQYDTIAAPPATG